MGGSCDLSAQYGKHDVKQCNILHTISSNGSPGGRNKSQRNSINEQKLLNLENTEYFFGEYKKKFKDGTTKSYKLSDILKDYENPNDGKLPKKESPRKIE